MSQDIPSDFEAIEAARELAAQRHAGQNYGDGSVDYLWHLHATAAVLLRFGVRDTDMLAAAYLHDLLEDTETRAEEIDARFGPKVAELVVRVTDRRHHPLDGHRLTSRPARHRATYPQIAADARATRLKLADRIAHVEAAVLFGDTARLAMYAGEWDYFSRTLRRPGENDALWAYLRGLLQAHSKPVKEEPS